VSDLAVVARVASAEVGELLRRIIRETVGDRVSKRASGLAVAALLTGLTVLLTLQALGVGRQLGSGFGPGMVATIFTGFATALGMTALVGTHVWSRITSRERERLAILPLGRVRLSLLAAVPALVPTALGLYLALPSIIALSITTRVGAVTILGSVALGVGMPLALAALWTLPMLVLRPRRDLVVVALVAVSLAALLGHALRLAATQGAAPTGTVPNPVLWVLTKGSQYSLSEAALSLLFLTVSVVALATVRHLRSAQRPRPTRQAVNVAAPPARVPVAPRVWVGLVRVIWRQSSLVAEIGVAAVLGATVCFFASILLPQGRFTHAYTSLLIAAGFGALPLLGLQGTLGPTYRLTQMGMRPSDIRLGLVGAGVAFQGLSLAPGVAVLVWRGASVTDVVVFGALAAVTFGIVVSIGSVLRRITATSLGRSLGVALAMVPFYLLIRIGVPSWPFLGIMAAAVGTLAFLGATLGLTVRRTSLR
jgi:hypothetical protein